MKADTSHIEACQNAWYRHFRDCKQCYYSQTAFVRCATGKVIYDEYRSAITANRDCEQVKAKAVE